MLVCCEVYGPLRGRLNLKDGLTLIQAGDIKTVHKLDNNDSICNRLTKDDDIKFLMSGETGPNPM